MNSLIAAVSAIIFTISGTNVDIQPTENVESAIYEIVNDPDCEVVVAQNEIIKVEKSDIEMVAKLIWGEARGVNSKAEQAAVAWCVINRVEAGYGDTLEDVITAPSQFSGYRKGNPVTDELYDLALDVLVRWEMENNGYSDVGRTLPSEYLYFAGSGGRNYFRTSYSGGSRWDWSLPDPYV